MYADGPSCKIPRRGPRPQILDWTVIGASRALFKCCLAADLNSVPHELLTLNPIAKRSHISELFVKLAKTSSLGIDAH